MASDGSAGSWLPSIAIGLGGAATVGLILRSLNQQSQLTQKMSMQMQMQLQQQQQQQQEQQQKEREQQLQSQRDRELLHFKELQLQRARSPPEEYDPRYSFTSADSDLMGGHTGAWSTAKQMKIRKENEYMQHEKHQLQMLQEQQLHEEQQLKQQKESFELEQKQQKQVQAQEHKQQKEELGRQVQHHKDELQRQSVTMSTKMKSNLNDILLISGSAHPALAAEIARHLGKDLMKTVLDKFSNGESRVELSKHCRGKDVYIIQSMVAVPERVVDGKVITRKSLNDILMETLLLVNAARGSSAKRITVMMPMIAYPRQDKKEKARVAVVGRLVADLLETAGIDRAISVDLHSSQIQGFYMKPLDNVFCESFLVANMKKLMKHRARRVDRTADDGMVKLFVKNNVASAETEDDEEGRDDEDYGNTTPNRRLSRIKDTQKSMFVVVSPHASGAKRATRLADNINVACAVLNSQKRSRDQRENYEVEDELDKTFSLVGEVSGRIAILVDDLTDTSRTLMSAATFLKQNGALEVHGFVLHGVLSSSAIQDINECKSLQSLTVTNSLPQTENMLICPKLKVIDISPLLAEAIGRLHCKESLHEMYTSGNGH